MTKFKKGAIAAFAAVLAATGVTAAVLPYGGARVNYAAAEIVSVEGVDLDITDGVLNGFKADATIPSNVKLVIPDDVTSIKANAFEGCTQIISVTLPSSLISIGQDAFKGCVRIAELIDNSELWDVPDGNLNQEYQNLMDQALSINPEKELVEDENGYIFCEEYLVGYNGSLTELTLPLTRPSDFIEIPGGDDTMPVDTSYFIRDYAFTGGNFTAVNLKDANINEIGISAFEN